MLRPMILALGTAATVLSAATPAMAAVSLQFSFGTPVVASVAQIGPVAVGGVVVQAGVRLLPDGMIAEAPTMGGPIGPADYGPCQQLVVYQPDGYVRTIIVRDADHPVYERYLMEHRERFFWRPYRRPAFVERQAFVRRPFIQPGAPEPGGWQPNDGRVERTAYWGDRQAERTAYWGDRQAERTAYWGDRQGPGWRRGHDQGRHEGDHRGH